MNAILGWPLWAIIPLGIVFGFAFGAIVRFLIWLLSKLYSWLKKIPSFMTTVGKFFSNSGKNISSWLKRKIRLVCLVIIGMLLVWMTIAIDSSALTIMGICAVVGFFIYTTLLDERLLDGVIKIWRRIIDRPLMSLARDSGEHFGIYMMTLGLLILVIGILLVLVNAENISDLVSLGLALLFGGVGFIALHLSAQSDKRIAAMASLEYNEKMAILSDSITNIKTNPFHTDTRSISYHVRSVIKLKDWLEPEEVAKLSELLTYLEDSINEFKSSITQETWEKSAYPALLAELDSALATIQG